MKGLSTKKAFDLLISKRKWWQTARISEIRATNYKARFKSGDLSTAKMEEILISAGGTVIQEKLWSKIFLKHNYMVDRYNEEDFPSFVNELIDARFLEKKEQGIAKLMLDVGYTQLTSKQQYVFDQNVITPFYVDSCERCCSDIPWCEMSSAHDNGGYCSWCANSREKND